MINFALLKKEFKEIFKTYKIWIFLAIFLFFGFLSPVTAKLTPEILKSAFKEQKIMVTIPKPTVADSFGQFFKNLIQLGVLAIILLSVGLVSEEKTKGTLQMIVTKPISRTAIIFAKFLAQTTVVSFSMIIGAIICYLYTLILFKEGSFLNFSEAIMLFLLYYVLIIAITLFFSTIFRNQIAAGGLSILTFFILSLLPSLHTNFDRYSPADLTSLANKIVIGKAGLSESVPVVAITLLIIIVLLTINCWIFNQQEL